MYRYVWLVCKTHAKIVLSDPETLLIDDPVSLAVEAITWTITWKPPIVPVVWIMLKFFETTGAIRTIIWKPGFIYLPPNNKHLEISISV